MQCALQNIHHEIFFMTIRCNTYNSVQQEKELTLAKTCIH